MQISIQDFAQACQHPTPAMPLASGVEKGIPVYCYASKHKQALQNEWRQVLMQGAGALVIKAAQPNFDAIDAATAVFFETIAQERQSQAQAGDHFAQAGNNDRIWNSLQKLALSAPEVFVHYHASPAIDAVAEAWLGPCYQMTAQVNLVRPGGKAQQVHRDYHLGFQSNTAAAQYPEHVHALSPLLTLQGALAHCAMPIESGPTKLLLGSQRYLPGYLAWRDPEFIQYFEAHCVQAALEKGDALFFNPALFHAAGDNYSQDVQRIANLLQVSSAFGRAMESVDRSAMCLAVYSAALASKLDQEHIHAMIACCAEGYSFPTNLDSDPPLHGLAPITQHQLMHQALEKRLDLATFKQQLQALSERQLPL